MVQSTAAVAQPDPAGPRARTSAAKPMRMAIPIALRTGIGRTSRCALTRRIITRVVPPMPPIVARCRAAVSGHCKNPPAAAAQARSPTHSQACPAASASTSPALCCNPGAQSTNRTPINTAPIANRAGPIGRSTAIASVAKPAAKQTSSAWSNAGRGAMRGLPARCAAPDAAAPTKRPPIAAMSMMTRPRPNQFPISAPCCNSPSSPHWNVASAMRKPLSRIGNTKLPHRLAARRKANAAGSTIAAVARSERKARTRSGTAGTT